MKNFEYIGQKNMLPQEYTVIGYAYRIPTGTGDFEAEIDINEGDLNNSVYCDIIDKVHNKTNCNHCGSAIRNIVIVRHENGSIHTFGSICGEDTKNFSHAKNDQLKTVAMFKRKKYKKQFEMSEILDANIGLTEALTVNHKIIVSINDNFKKYAKLSVKQIDLVFKLAKQENDKKAKQVENNVGVVSVPLGRIKKSDFKIVAFKVKIENDFDGYEVERLYLTLEHKDGWKVYGGLKNTLKDIVIDDMINMSLTLSQSQTNRCFGFFKRALVH